MTQHRASSGGMSDRDGIQRIAGERLRNRGRLALQTQPQATPPPRHGKVAPVTQWHP